jgi:Hint module
MPQLMFLMQHLPAPATLIPLSNPPPIAPTSTYVSEAATVHVQGKGITTMRDLHVSDKVLVQHKTNQSIYKSVNSVGHYNQLTPTEYLSIYSGQNKPLEISPGHLLYVQGKEHPTRADSMQARDILLRVSADASNTPTHVMKIERVIRNGAYASHQGWMACGQGCPCFHLCLNHGLCPCSDHQVLHLRKTTGWSSSKQEEPQKQIPQSLASVEGISFNRILLVLWTAG